MSYVDFRINDNVRKYQLEDKNEIIYDLLALDNSFTGRIGASVANTFILESAQMLVNSITIFEMGYFDAAYYCLRESLEMATLMAYFVDLPTGVRKAELLKWKDPKNRFSMQKQMLSDLKENGRIIKDMKNHMKSFFERIEKISNELNKYVHKQGFDKLYISANHPLSLGANPEKEDNEICDRFDYYLKECISIVGIMRLSVDPMPLLLLDDEIYNRTEDIISDPYSMQFVEKYLKKEDIEDYKKTDIYCDTYKEFMKATKMSNCVTDIYKSHCIDLEKKEIILNEISLLKFPYNIATLLIIEIDDVTKVFLYDGLMTFFSSRKCNSDKFRINTMDFRTLEKDSFNNSYNELYLSSIVINNTTFYIEHNNKFSNDKIKHIKMLRDKIDGQMQ